MNKMPIIKFGFIYKKMPESVLSLDTWIKDIALINYDQLTPEEIKQDTETIDGQFYQLPQTRLIWIKLWSDTINGGQEWATLRRYTPEKFRYYSSIVGQQVRVTIEPMPNIKMK